MPPPHAFGAYLTRAMDVAGLTIADLKRLTGVADSLISRWREGVMVPSVPNLRRLAPALAVPTRDLIVAAGHMTPEEVGLAAFPEPPGPPQTAEEIIAADTYFSDRQKAAILALLGVLREENAGNSSNRRRREG
jgi:transcriptional regulator with XRE-family HTH domain